MNGALEKLMDWIRGGKEEGRASLSFVEVEYIFLRIQAVLEEDRKGRELPGEKIQELRSQISPIRHRWDQLIDPSVGEKGTLFHALETIFAAIDFRDALINDLRQDSTAYQRGVEEGRKEIIRRLILKVHDPLELIKEFAGVVKEFWG